MKTIKSHNECVRVCLFLEAYQLFESVICDCSKE